MKYLVFTLLVGQWSYPYDLNTLSGVSVFSVVGILACF